MAGPRDLSAPLLQGAVFRGSEPRSQGALFGSGHSLYPGDGEAGLAQELGAPLPVTSVAAFGGCSGGGRSPRRGAEGTGPRLAAATSVLCVPKPLGLCVPGAGARAGGGRGSRAQVALRGAGCGDRDGLAEAGKAGRGTLETAEPRLEQVWVSGCCSGRCAKLGVGPARENCGGCCSSTGGGDSGEVLGG